MSTSNDSETTVRGTATYSSAERLVGCVKWFNNKAGYGFITVSEGERSGTDVFIHHSSINVKNQQYKYLVQGEYVEFTIISTAGGSHEFQAADVSGIKNGKLMCETRFEMKLERNHSPVEEEAIGNSSEVRLPRTKRPPGSQNQNFTEAPKARGEGPRNGNEWTQVRRGDRQKTQSQEPRSLKKHE
jgi:cold shock CspA family protein